MNALDRTVKNMTGNEETETINGILRQQNNTTADGKPLFRRTK